MEATKIRDADSKATTVPDQPDQSQLSQGPSSLDTRSIRPLIVSIVATIVVVAAVIAFIVGRSRSASRTERQPGMEAERAAVDPNLVTIDPSQTQDIKSEQVVMQPFRLEKSATGKITFDEDYVTPVFSPYTGRIVQLIARPGDVVTKGSPLFEIDTPDLVQAESDLVGATSAVAKDKTVLDLLRRTEERQHKLYLNKAVALKDWEQAESDVKNAESDLRSAETALSATRDRLRVFGKSDADIAAIERERKIDRITRVPSPISGTITLRKVGPGQYVKPDNPDPLFTIANLSTMWMLADVYESDVPYVKVGQPVEVRVMAFPSEIFKARVSYIGASVDPNTHRIAVRCVVENRGQKLKPDMFAGFRIITNSETQSPAVRISAVVRDGDKTSVWVAQDGDRFARRDVTLGVERQGYVQVLSGIQPGDKVVYEGSLFLTNLGK